jgi:hypothetical protein
MTSRRRSCLATVVMPFDFYQRPVIRLLTMSSMNISTNMFDVFCLVCLGCAAHCVNNAVDCTSNMFVAFVLFVNEQFIVDVDRFDSIESSLRLARTRSTCRTNGHVRSTRFTLLIDGDYSNVFRSILFSTLTSRTNVVARVGRRHR